MSSEASGQPRYNKGEWAELLALAKLLCEGSVSVGVFNADSSARHLQVTSISRTSSVREEFIIDSENVRIATDGRVIKREDICARVKNLLPAILVGDWAVSASTGTELLTWLGIPQLKIGTDKADLYLNVRDPLTGARGLQGYSVKSFLGSAPTLFNASLATNFTYAISPPIPDGEVAHYNSLRTREMCRELIEAGHSFRLVDHHPGFGANLSILDARMVDVIAHALVAYYGKRCGTEAGLSVIANYLGVVNPLAVGNPSVFYRYKLMDLLEAITYGMVPSKPWDGQRSAPGGLLIVDKDGGITCIQAGNSDEHREYLLQSTKFDTPSRSKHRFGHLHQHEGEWRLRLNLHIRYR